MRWARDGETVAVLARWRGPGAALREGLPDGVRPWPGPCAVTVTRSWRAGGPFVELRVLRPVRQGLRPRWWPVISVADGAAGGTATLTWTVDRDSRATRSVHWVEQDVTIRVRPGRLAMPVRDGWGRLGRGEVRAPERSRLAPLAGRHRGLIIGSPSTSASVMTAPAAASASLSLAPMGPSVIGNTSLAASVADDPVDLRLDVVISR